MDLAQLVQDVIDGNESGLIALAVLKEQKQLIDNYIKEVEVIAQEEAEMYSEKSFDLKGYRFEKRSGGRMYNFKNIPEWQDYKKALTDCEERAKQAYLSYEKGMFTANSDGEEVVLPEVTNRKDSIVIKRLDKTPPTEQIDDLP